jgi:DNA end-binding protein Ku
LLHRALTRTGKIGIAKAAIWNREYLAAVKPDGLFLVLELMHFAHEILNADELVRQPAKELNEQEIKMAETLVETMSATWQRHKYKDEYRDALLEIIEGKAQNKDIDERPLAPISRAPAVDLLKVLQESINRSRAVKPQRKRQRGRSAAALVAQAAAYTLVRELRFRELLRRLLAFVLRNVNPEITDARKLRRARRRRCRLQLIGFGF